MKCLLTKRMKTQMEVRGIPDSGAFLLICVPSTLPTLCYNLLLAVSPSFFKHVVCAEDVVFFHSHISWSQIIGVGVVT